jgi:hypothetical protein
MAEQANSRQSHDEDVDMDESESEIIQNRVHGKSLLCCNLVGEERVLRVVVLISYVCAAVLCGWVTFRSVSSVAHSSAVDLFNSVADQGLVTVHKRLQNMEYGGLVLANMYRYSDSAWPNAYLAGFTDIAGQLAATSQMESFAFMPLVKEPELGAFEQFIFPAWDADPSVPATAAFTPQGRGVFDFCDPDPTCIRRVNGTATAEYPFYLPLTQVHASATTPSSLVGIDIASSPNTDTHHRAYDCVVGQTTAAAARACKAYDLVYLPFLSDSLQLRMIVPIVLDDTEDTVTSDLSLVGFIGGVVLAEELLADLVPAFVGRLTYVLQWGEQAYTFCIKKGKVVQLSVGDQHDRKHSSKGRQQIVLHKADIQLSIYPTDEYFTHAQGSNVNALAAAFGVAGMIMLCSLLFLLYDLAVSRASTRQGAALETKRRFVRFISHEVRTPLNSVRLGMDIFVAELAAFAQRLGQVPASQLLQEVQVRLADWKDLAADVRGNTSAAVDVLNDLLQFDKVSVCVCVCMYVCVLVCVGVYTYLCVWVVDC